MNMNGKQLRSQQVQSFYISNRELDSLKTVYEHLPCTCLTLNSMGDVLVVSEFGETYLGYKTVELTQQSIQQIFYWEDRVICQRKLTELLQQLRGISQWQTRIVRKDGEIRWVKVIARLVNQSESHPLITLVCEDISECKRVESALGLSDFSFERFAMPAFWLKQEGSILRVNEVACQVLQYTREELHSMHFYDIAPDFSPQVWTKHWQALKNEKILTFISRNRSKDGTIIPVEVTLNYLEFNGEEYNFVFCRDITDRLQNEAELLHQSVALDKFSANLKKLHRLNTTKYNSFEDLFSDYLKTGCDILQLSTGIISQIENQTYRICSVQSDLDGLVPDLQWELKNTYCSAVVNQEKTIAYRQVSELPALVNHPLYQKLKLEAYIGTRIIVNQQIYGTLSFCSTQPRRTEFDTHEREIIELMAQSIGNFIATHQGEIERHKIEATLRQQLLREQLVGAIAGRIRKSLKLENILKATVAQVRQVLQTDRVIIFGFASDWSRSVIVESVDKRWSSIWENHPYDPSFAQTYILPSQQGQVKAIEDIYTENLDPSYIKFLETFQVRAKLIVPIFRGEQLWGILIAHHCSEPRKWQHSEIELLSSLSSHVEIAIQQSQLYEKAKSLLLREQAINQVTQAIRSTLDLTTIFATAVNEIGAILDVDHVQIMQYIPQRQVWLGVSEYRKCPESKGTLGVEIPDQDNPIAQRIKQLEIVKINDTQTCEDPINQDFARRFPGAWLLVPLHVGSSVWGTLSLIKRLRPYYWQDFEIEFICAVANQIAIAIQQAELYKQSCLTTAKALTQTKQLEQTLQKLQKAQAQLVQSEKMSSLGQLVAGVAHEINNPVSFIYGNLAHGSEYVKDLLDLLQLYQQQYPNPTPQIAAKIETIELEFLLDDLPKLLNSMKIGAERICGIVSSLRNFSRLAEADLKIVDIHEGIESTLTLLQNRLKPQGKYPGIQVIKEYGTLPLVECYAGQLNQVFMNLFVNAIDAIQEYFIKCNCGSAPHQGEIRVCTENLGNEQIRIRIIDNGIGMTDEVKAKLFDPFFTTKPIGAGTGLGLSISYQIVVEKHHGQLYCESQWGKGSEFVLQIPLSLSTISQCQQVLTDKG